jgi:hypothetical protein
MAARIADPRFADDHVLVRVGYGLVPRAEHAQQEIARLLAPRDRGDRVGIKGLVRGIVDREIGKTPRAPIVFAIGPTEYVTVGDRDMLVAGDAGIPVAVMDHIVPALLEQGA